MLVRQTPLQSPSNGERGWRDKLGSTCLTEENRTTHVSHPSVWHLSYALSVVLLDGQTVKCCYLSISDRMQICTMNKTRDQRRKQAWKCHKKTHFSLNHKHRKLIVFQIFNCCSFVSRRKQCMRERAILGCSKDRIFDSEFQAGILCQPAIMFSWLYQ